MFQIDNTIISDEVLENEFVCNLKACKGQCCIDGDAGAPLSEEEIHILEDIYEEVEPYLSDDGKKSIEAQGKWVMGVDGEFETPLIDGGACAYVIFENNMALCGIEKAYLEKKIDYKKPISCHLYPIRIKDYTQFSSVNYHHWSICSDACSLGKELQVPVYQFLKEPLIRRFGERFYEELSLVATEWKKQKEIK